MIDDDLVLHVEAALLAAGRPVPIDEFIAMFESREDPPDRSVVREAVAALEERWTGHAIEVSEVASGFRAQIRKEYSQSIAALWQERPPRYSRALLETLALIAYRQPISRGEIEEVRGVSVSSSIMKTLLEREWVRVVGHREAPGRPALFGTTKHFLDTFNLKSLEALPPLAELKDLDEPPPDLFTGLQEVAVPGGEADSAVAGAGGESQFGDVDQVFHSHGPDPGSGAHDAPESAAPVQGPAEEAAESASSGGGDGVADSSALDDSAASAPQAEADRSGPAD